MSDDDKDDNKRMALIIVTAVVALVVAGVTTLGVFKARGGAAQAAAPAVVASAPAVEAAPVVAEAASEAAPAAPVVAEAAVDKVFFAKGADKLPDGSADILARVADAARANSAAMVHISGFHDASGNPERNAELAKRRAFAVRDALIANGVAETQIQLNKPALTEGDGDPAEARRVELSVR